MIEFWWERQLVLDAMLQKVGVTLSNRATLFWIDLRLGFVDPWEYPV